MLVYPKGFLKCGSPGVPFFCVKRKPFFTKSTRIIYNLTSAPGDRVYFNNNLRYSSKSIEVVEEAASDMGLKEDKAETSALSSYDDAMEALSTLISRRNRGDRSLTRGNRDKLEQVRTYLKILDLEDKIKELKVIHVAGTKGKLGYIRGKVSTVFWECWKLLKVDVTIIEVGLGGKRDSTNVIQKPVVCGIASLGMDHMDILGNTLADIAFHKAGIFKYHNSEATEVLQETAKNLKVPLEVIAPLDLKKLNGVTLGLSGDHQLVNAGLAVSLTRCWLQRTGNWQKIYTNGSKESEIPVAFSRGLATARLHGRAQVVHDVVSDPQDSSGSVENPCGDLIFYLDGAHSPERMEVCGRWFSTAVRGNKSLPTAVNGYMRNGETGRDYYRVSKQILLFNCMEVRDPQVLLPHLVTTCATSGTYFSRALFVPSMSTYNKVISGASAISIDTRRKDLTWQFRLQRLWEKSIQGTDAALDHAPKLDGITTLPPHDFLCGDAPHCSGQVTSSAVMPSLPLTINWLRDCVRGNPSLKLEVLVTGSLHLVGDVLRLLKR